MPQNGKEAVNMKATGIVRKVDELGRIVLPIELRRTLDIEERDPLEIYLDGDKIVLQKYEPACLFCGSNHGLVSYKGKNICSDCVKNISRH
jgi:transcriptional pleiotropic regulator of transition state genes